MNGETEVTREFSGAASVFTTSSFTSPVNTALGEVIGLRVTISATDIKENANQLVAYSEPNAPAKISKFVSDTLGGTISEAVGEILPSELAKLVRVPTAYSGGVVSGLFAGAGQFVKEILALIELVIKGVLNPIKFFKGILDVFSKVGLLDVLVLPVAVAQSIFNEGKRALQRNNPYKEGKPEFKSFQVGFTVGYVSAFVLSLFAGAAVKSLAQGTRVAKVLKQADTVLSQRSRLYRGLKFVKGKKDALEKRVLVSIARVVGTPVKLAVDGLRTAGSRLRVAKLERQLEFDTSRLGPNQRDTLREFLKIQGDDAVRTLDRLDEDEREELLDIGTACGRPRPAFDGGSALGSLRGGGSCDLSNEELDELRQTVARLADDEESFYNTIDDLDGAAEQELYDAILDADAELSRDIVRMIEDVSPSRLNELKSKGIDLAKHARGLAVYRDYKNQGKNIDGKGDMAEVLAHERLKQEFPDAEVFPKFGLSLDIKRKDGETIADIDHFIIRDGKVVRVFETKAGVSDELSPTEQIEQSLRRLETVDRDAIKPEGGTSGRLTIKYDYPRVLNDNKVSAIGPRDSQRDLESEISLQYSSEQIGELAETIEEEGL